MESIKQVFSDRWPELRGKVREQWGKLSDDELTHLDGNIEELIYLLQLRYGYANAQAKINIGEWLQDLELQGKL